LYRSRKYILLRGQKAKIGLQSPKTEFGAQNQYGHVICPSIGNFTWSKKKYTFGGQKGENRPPEPKNGIWGPKSKFGAQNQYGRVIHPSIGNFTWSKKYILLGVKKVKIGPQSPKNEIWGPKSIWLWSKKIYTFGFQSPKTELRPKNIKNKFSH
jgi:hypothetical protein